MSCTEALEQARETDAYVRNLLPNAEGRVRELERRLVNSRDVIGDPAIQGALRMRVFQGHVIGRLDPESGNAIYDGSGSFADPEADIDANSASNVWMHFKLPLSTKTHSGMFYLKMTGYLYGTSGIIDETFVGYCYAVTGSLIQDKTEGNYDPSLYKGSDGFVYARIKVPSTYYVTMAIDSMRVGNGPLFGVGDLVVTVTSDKEYL